MKHLFGTELTNKRAGNSGSGFVNLSNLEERFYLAEPFPRRSNARRR